MAGITHTTVAVGAADPSKEINADEWNDEHTIADKAISYTKLADGTDGNLITWDSNGVAALVATGTATHVLTSNGAGAAPTFQAPAAGGSTLDGITAATADQAGIANADWNVRWNWQKTTNSEVAFEIGESAASTSGTSTNGVPNQVIAKFSTVAASTASPLSVYSRAAHVFSVSPTSAQIVLGVGTAGAPILSPTTSLTNGIFFPSSTTMGWASGGAEKVRFGANQTSLTGGSASAPGVSDYANGDSGIFWGASGVVGISVSVVENARFIATGLQASQASASAVSYALSFRKSRGTVASPTVITTADDLATISGYGYVGATGTYVEAARLTFDSTGTIADTTSGVGGIARMALAAVGAVGPAEVMRWQRATTTGGGWATMNEADASPATTDLADGDEAAVYIKAGNIVFAQNVGGAMKFLFCPIDGSTTTWTADGTGP